MTITDDEVRIENIEIKLKLNRDKHERLLEVLKERLRRDRLGVINAEQKIELAKPLTLVIERIGALEMELEHAIEIAGLSVETPKST